MTDRESFLSRWSRVIQQANRCRRCGKSADAFDCNGVLLCADCMFDEAEPASVRERGKEKQS